VLFIGQWQREILNIDNEYLMMKETHPFIAFKVSLPSQPKRPPMPKSFPPPPKSPSLKVHF
jgi:hypothetical protein